MKQFSLIYTSARPALISAVCREWVLKARWPSAAEIIICVDENNEAARVAALRTQLPVILQPDPDGNCVKGWNLAASHSTAPLILAISDDFSPPLEWDIELLKLAPPGWTKESRVVHVNDGHQPDLCTLAILTRKRYAEKGYVFWPEYESLFCDNDFTDEAREDGVLLEATHLLFEHRHYAVHKRQQDSVDLKHASPERYAKGKAIYERRRHLGKTIWRPPVVADSRQTSP